MSESTPRSGPEAASGAGDTVSDGSRDAVTRLLHEAANGRPGAAGELMPLVYNALRDLARRRMARERSDHTLQATALVHEAYLKLVGGGGGEPDWADRSHFYHAAAEAMRRILIDHARAKAGPKRGAGRRRVPLDVLDLAAESDSDEILALDEAVSRLQRQSPDVAAVVRLRFYAGLGVEETAAALGVSVRTVNREWTYARAWLFRELGYGAH